MGQKSHVQRLVDADNRYKPDVAQRVAADHTVYQLGPYDGCAEKYGGEMAEESVRERV